MTEQLEADPPVSLWVFDKAYARQGTATPEAVEWLGVWNGAGSLVFTVLADSPRVAALTAPGARVVATLNRPGFPTPKVLISGPVKERRGIGMTEIPERIFTVAGDAGIFDEIVCWPVPGAAITAQGTADYHVVTGPAETVLRTLVSANAPRQGVPVEVAASTGLGATMTVKLRMHTLGDKVIPRVSALGLGVRVEQDPDETVRRLITWVPTTHTKVLTEESGIVLPGAEFSIQAPSATRVVVGAGGEGTARVFRQIIDAALETAWGVSRSVFVDARDIAATDPDLTALIAERAAEALAENSEVTSLKIELVETDNWQYGTTFDLGDIVPIRLVGESTVTDRINEVALSWQAGSGLEITPRIGAWEESPDDRLQKLVAKALKTGRNLEVTQ